MKYTRFLTALFVHAVLLGFGCNVIPSSPIETGVSIRLPSNYLIFCDNTFDGDETVVIRWSVDALEVGGTTSLFAMGRERVDNDDNNPANLEFPITVPESGTYSITVECELTCSSCCSQLQDPDGNVPCNLVNSAGEPVFREVSLMINQTPPSGVIDVNPIFQNCFFCGCED